ncbi:DUF58 domain-containing protein [Thermospira aquatica]|uniref:DUF58 domain-containing protein n=1 Tax=Thermospira aquatica TaxID=2828656 RepID=A0AAX3BAA1_9SPIR|nr:DUF58 domain-containing protein [Thermospira aquatica]URA09182.1 DUF58 domain-containing protein [Thermospira aquatica]
MNKRLWIFLGILILFVSLFIELGGLKIFLYASLLFLGINRLYLFLVPKYVNIKRFLETTQVFSTLPEDNFLHITNTSLLPVGYIFIRDAIDIHLAPRQSYPFLLTLKPRERQMLSYSFSGRRRGKFIIGPTTILFSDFIGWDEIEIEHDTRKAIIVYPTLFRLSGHKYKSMQPFGIIKNPMPIFEDPTLITGLKEYNAGDDIRRINWKVSARQGKFYINTYQPAISSASLVILNLASEDYDFHNKDYYIERAIEVTASLLRELFLLRQEMALVINCRIDNVDQVLDIELGKGESHLTNMLSHLATIEAAKNAPFRDILSKHLQGISWGVSLFVISPRLSHEIIQQLINLQHMGHSITIIQVGPEISRELSLWNIGFQSYYAEHEATLIQLTRL